MEDELQVVKSEIKKLVSINTDYKLLCDIRDKLKIGSRSTETKITNEYLKEIFKDIEKSSLNTYSRFLTRFTKEELLDYTKITSYIETKYQNHNTKYGFYKILISYFTRCLDKPEIKEKYYEKYIENKLLLEDPNKPKILKVSYEEFYNFVMSLYEKDIDSFIPLYLQMICTVRTDFKSIKIKNYNPEKDNYINLKKKQIVFNSRTKNTCAYTHILTNENLSYIKTFIEDAIKKRDYLFVNKFGNPMSSSCYTKFITRCFRDNCFTILTINDIRHVIVSEAFSGMINNKEIKEQCEKLGHSLTDALKYYRYDPKTSI